VSEQEIREGMLLAVWDEPPLDFDPDALMKRAEQKKSRRRALVSVGVATALIVVSAFALPGLLPKTRDGDQIAAPPTASSTEAPAEDPYERSERIGNQLAEKLGLEMSDLREVYGNVQPGSNHQVVVPPTRTTTRGATGDTSLVGYVHLTDHIGPTSLEVRAMRYLQSQRSLCLGAFTCQELAQADGSKVTAAEFKDGNTTTVRAVATRIFESGYTVQISSFVYNPATSSGTRQALPVPVQVLTTLVTDPRIRWE
jgi:hypothetical protein